MAYEHFRMDTSSMSAEPRDELLTGISKHVGIGWWNLSAERSGIFQLTWDNEYDFNQLVPHADECVLSPWESF